MPRVVINADDFGMSPAINAGIIEAHQRGVVNSASVMAGAPCAEEAIALASQHPGLRLGLHLVLADGRAVLPPAEIPGLVDDAGRFPAGPARAGVRYFFRRGLRTQLRAEITAQFAWLRDHDADIAHLDGHHHLHLHPTVCDLVCEIAPRFGAPTVRVVTDEYGEYRARGGRASLGARTHAAIFRRLRRGALPKLRAAGLPAWASARGLLRTGSVDAAWLEATLAGLPDGDHQIFCHPATEAGGEAWRVAELEAVCSAQVRAAFQRVTAGAAA